jgi:hypothetical protein
VPVLAGFTGMLLGGVFVGNSGDLATPRQVVGTIEWVRGDGRAFAFVAEPGRTTPVYTLDTPTGTPTYALGPVPWQDVNGLWHSDSTPDCLQGSALPARAAIGLVTVNRTPRNPPWMLVAWISCRRS